MLEAYLEPSKTFFALDAAFAETSYLFLTQNCIQNLNI